MQPNPVDTYLQEADDLLAEIEAAALSLTGDRSGTEAVNQIFRGFHTIKGSGAMFGFNDVAAFTHHVETLLDQVRDGLVPVSEQLSNVILAAADQIKLLLQAAQGGDPVNTISQAALLEKLNRTTEADFLAVGGKLMAFLTASRQLHSDIGGLTALVSGEQAQDACNALVSVRGYVQEMQSRSEDGGRALVALQASADSIHAGFPPSARLHSPSTSRPSWPESKRLT